MTKTQKYQHMMNNKWLLSSVSLLLILLILIGTIPTQAAVSGQFTASYDSDDSNSVPGREIQVTGSMEITGSNAVNPRIIVRGTEETVLDTGSVSLQIEGVQAVSFTRNIRKRGGVVFRTDEIPSGTEVSLEFVVYPREVNSTDISAFNVVVRYQTPEGNRETENFNNNINLSNSPLQQADQLRERNNKLRQKNKQLRNEIAGLPDWRQFFFILGGIDVVVIIIAVAFYIIKNRQGGPPGNDGPPSPPGS